MHGIPKRLKIAKVQIDRDGRVTFLRRGETPTEEEWWQSVLSDRRVRAAPTPINDTMLGRFAGRYFEIFCGNCHKHDWKKVDELLVMCGERCAVGQAVSAQVNWQRSAKRCDLQFKIRR